MTIQCLSTYQLTKAQGSAPLRRESLFCGQNLEMQRVLVLFSVVNHLDSTTSVNASGPESPYALYLSLLGHV